MPNDYTKNQHISHQDLDSSSKNNSFVNKTFRMSKTPGTRIVNGVFGQDAPVLEGLINKREDLSCGNNFTTEIPTYLETTFLCIQTRRRLLRENSRVDIILKICYCELTKFTTMNQMLFLSLKKQVAD